MLNRIVLGASVTSAFGDLTYETTNVMLPGFLAVLGVPAAILGTIEGIADAISSFRNSVPDSSPIGWATVRHWW